MKEISFSLRAKNRTHENCPISAIIETTADLHGSLWFENTKAHQIYPGYAWRINEKQVELFVMVDKLDSGEEFPLILITDPSKISSTSKIPAPMQAIVQENNTIDIIKNGKLFTTLHYNDAMRPYFMPVNGPFGDSVTREYPLKQGGKDATRDHIHHRSLWNAWGDVNGVDHWSEEKVARHQKVNDIQVIEAGPALTHIQLNLSWLDKEEKQSLVDEQRNIFIYNLMDGQTLIDFRLNFFAKSGDVVFGDTKEGGFVACRVADSYRGKKGGKIENAEGKKGERKCWGKQSAWCDYSGKVNKKEVGITMMDHPSNPFYPTYWHVRDYGLMAINPFGISEFKKDKKLNGSFTLKGNQSMELKFRVFIHAGNAKDAHVGLCAKNFTEPPELIMKNN